MPDNGKPVEICHIIVGGSSPWLLCRTRFRMCYILHVAANCLRFPPSYGKSDTISLGDFDHHSYVPLKLVDLSPSTAILSGFRATGTNKAVKTSMSWYRIKWVIDRVHERTCGQAQFPYIKPLVVINGLWNEAENHYLASIISSCRHFLATSGPSRIQNVSLSSVTREFNDTACIDHFYLEDQILCNGHWIALLRSASSKNYQHGWIHEWISSMLDKPIMVPTSYSRWIGIRQ